MRCPACGAESLGNFCSACGNPLKTNMCPECGVDVLLSSRFCTGCGTVLSGGVESKGDPAETRRARGNVTTAWWVAGIAMVVLLLVLGYPLLTRSVSPDGVRTAPTGMGSGSGESSPVDLTTMSLEEQGTVLFNRVMASNSSGDTADVAFFLPKALVIYEQLSPTDPDGLYHFTLLHQVGGDFEGALAKARTGLDQVPDYLLLLAAAAEASAALGDDAGARALYGRFLEVYDAEMALMRPGYEHHQPIFPEYRAQAQAYLNSG